KAGSLRFFQQPLAFTIELPPLARRQTADSELGNFIEDRIDRDVNVIRLRGTGGTHFGDNMEFGPGAKARLYHLPPARFWSGGMHFNEQEFSANACRNGYQIAPGVVREELKGVNRGKNQYDPFRHDPQKQLSPGIDGGEGNENSKVQR